MRLSERENGLARHVADAESVLRDTRLGGPTVPVLVRALRALSAAGEPERAVPWCTALRDESVRRGIAGWAAVFGTVHAELLLRQGDVRNAEQAAVKAMGCLPEGSGDAFALAPVAALVLARTGLGRHTAAGRLLDRPVPPELLDSARGLAYLRARGRHSLATGRFHAALGDFTEAGRVARTRSADRPSVLPWRSDAALALVRIGEPVRAEQLARQQLAGPEGHLPWVRGLALRAWAASVEPRRRTGLLEQAAEALGRSGDRLELARALADLAASLREQGVSGRAGALTRRAWGLAQSCGAEALCEEIAPGLAGRSRPAAPTPGDGHGPGLLTPGARARSLLSTSEQRVAALAAHGYTNREIAGRLFVTISTVEQHLTRVYRKLDISRRQELPVDLRMS
ncbi:helix-turn-helix transcriptional regulator [Streptomyces sp. JJ38]|uniref:helix-turn-helix domain-containing protein n=1 Tax=Streptomyces sp. JJ38 TaxID=2738128 RepID=UPI001C5820F4|nr:helix-turn-helix transcriptional regulator [Streptomyces sp. JJ38]MBW1598599.1 helix-turn-helix transcriptional regulator [Streptomyces sp. JJ38]